MLTEPTLTRRGFIKAGGALVVTLVLPDAFTVNGASAEAATLDATRVASWLEIRADGRIVVRTGRTETGTGMSGFYRQMVAEELSVRPELIDLVMGDTDRTPDGGYSADFLSGAQNLRKVAAYTAQALLGLAAAHLGESQASLTVTDGVVSTPGAGTKSVTYAQLVAGKQLQLTIPVTGGLPKVNEQGTGIAGILGITVTGNPPLRSVSQYKVIGQSFPTPGIPAIITGETDWVGDLRLPGMLHARMVRPATVGSTLVSVGALDRKRFPTAEIVTRANLVAVVSPDEWEAVSASRAVAAGTRWSDWAGLPGADNLAAVLRARGTASGSRGDGAKTEAALAGAAKTISVTYEQPYVKHAPIGPFVAVADVRGDGTVSVWTHSANSQALRAHLAYMLGTSMDNVTVRWLEGSGQYGRTSTGGDGAEADAVILSQLIGKPVRVQWTLQDDLAWSTASPAWVADLKAGLDASGRLVALQSDYYAPGQGDTRMLGAVLAGLPDLKPPSGVAPAAFWREGGVMYSIEPTLHKAYGVPSLGAEGPSGVGLRGNIMRTPSQRQHVFALESLLNEAAAVAGVDPIQFRLAHTRDQRLIDLLKKTADAAGWTPRPSPQRNARRSGAGPLTGRGMAAMYRYGSYWVGIAEVEVTPSTGKIIVTKFTLGIDPGKIINPRQLERVMEGGVVMGLGEALKEEMTFDGGKVTSTDWRRYQIMTMAETPEINIVTISRDDQGFGGGGEAANALPQPAVVAAVFDATGVQPRRTPLTSAYLRQLFEA